MAVVYLHSIYASFPTHRQVLWRDLVTQTGDVSNAQCRREGTCRNKATGQLSPEQTSPMWKISGVYAEWTTEWNWTYVFLWRWVLLVLKHTIDKQVLYMLWSTSHHSIIYLFVYISYVLSIQTLISNKPPICHIGHLSSSICSVLTWIWWW